MWVMTPRGFFSVVEKQWDQEGGWVTIRAREKKDLDNLCADLLTEATPFQEQYWTDYPWRIRVKKEQWADALHQMAMEIDYSNFKDRVKTTDAKRASVYGRVWGALLDITVGDHWKSWTTGSYSDPPGVIPTMPQLPLSSASKRGNPRGGGTRRRTRKT